MSIPHLRLTPQLRNCALILLAAWMLLAAGCRTKSPTSIDGQRPSQPPEQELRARATTLWNAKVAEDWPTVFLFEDTRDDANVTVEDFITYCENEEPFKVHSCTIGRVATDDNMPGAETCGWVELDVCTSLRRFAGAPKVDSHRWQKWRRSKGVWMPVPSDKLDEYPASPMERDLAKEPELRVRFDEAWQAREAGDWAKLYTLVDPDDRAVIAEDKFTTTHSLINFLRCDVHWVQVTNGHGTVFCTIHHKLTDPSMTKMPEQTVVLREDWIQRDGIWYLDYQPN